MTAVQEIDAATESQIERWFLEGKRHAEDGGKGGESPYRVRIGNPGTTMDGIAHHWWTRGFSHSARLLYATTLREEVDLGDSLANAIESYLSRSSDAAFVRDRLTAYRDARAKDDVP